MSFNSELSALWQNPPSSYRSAPFWSWNARLTPQRLVRQIEAMHRAGMGGFFMHSRYGLKTPYLSKEWFECVTACIDKARELQMKAYLYDEDRWPSGSAGGAVTREHPEYRLHYLVCKPADRPCPDDSQRIALFEINLDADGRITSYRQVDEPQGGHTFAFDFEPSRPGGWYNDGTYPDTMNEEAVAEFIHQTHQAYADRYESDFGDLVPAIFTDEPNYGTTMWGNNNQQHVLQWTALLGQEFRRRRGYDLHEHLPELIYPLAGGDFSRVRCDYRRTITELFVENFTAQIGKWCQSHRLALTGHMLEEQTLETQTRAVGAAMPHYEYMQWPGIDILTDQSNELATAKQCTSVADQLGLERVLSELYGCTGWDWPLEGHKFVGDWQYAVGVNFRCPHLTHYSLEGGAKRDYPASIFEHSPWWKYYGVVEDYFARLSLMLTQGQPVRDVLVIHPIESAWGAYVPALAGDKNRSLTQLQGALNAITRTLSNNHYDWDFADESLLAKHGRASGKTLKLGRMSYKLVIVPPNLTLRGTTAAILRKFTAAGGLVLLAGEQGGRLDGQHDARLASETSAWPRCAATADELVSKVESMLPRQVSVTEGGREATFVWTMLRAVKGGQLLFVQSHDRSNAHTVHVKVAGGKNAILWDCMTGQRRRIDDDLSDSHVAFELNLPPSGSALVTLGVSVREALGVEQRPEVENTQSMTGPFEIELAEPNTMPLDYCSFRVGDGEWSNPVPALKADELIRKHFDLDPRANRGHQPWYLYAKGVIDNAVRGRCQLRFVFHVTQPPAKCLLAIERPEDFEVTVNSRPARKVVGYWVDEDIKTLDIALDLREGDNEIMLTFDYRPDMEIEDLYLVGDFGVRGRTPQGQSAALAPDNVTMVAPPSQLTLGSWRGQGLDFYGGGVRYKLRLEKPAGKRVRIALQQIKCTAAAIHVRGRTFVLPWPPFEADITDALADGPNDVVVEVIGGRKNILGPLHVPWEQWTGPGQFDPNYKNWTFEYQLHDHGLIGAAVFEMI